jgi:hypothetical protein
MRPERPSGASGCPPQTQENSTEHSRAGVYTRAESGGTAALTGCAYADSGGTGAFAGARANSDSGHHACEPNALTLGP